MSTQYILTPLLKKYQIWHRWPLLIFKSQSQGQTAGLCTNVVCSISLDFFAWKFPNFVQWVPLGRRWPILIFRSNGQRSRPNYWSLYNCCLLIIFWPHCLTLYSGIPKKVNVVYLISGQKVKLLILVQMSLLHIFFTFFFMWSKVKVKLLIFILTVFYSICYDNLIPIDITKVTSYKSRSNCKLQLWKCSIIKKNIDYIAFKPSR